MYDKLVTITVPMYNIEQYITKCIESFKQVDKKYYADFEVIVVNDGSTDNSLQVVEDLITNSSCLNIRVVNKENGGHGSTINVGIKESKGKFFKVIDGDDWIDVPSFEKLLEELKGIDVDMVITNYTEQHIYNQTEKEIGFSEILDCNKIYEGIPFKRIPMHALTYKTSILKES
ncbi:TPA: glycosyltransferase family 2 protein, partial [Streptococcus pneumoniae]|nr:glycosyltransferase family 2 protein [Streptococcus pneumoniae]